MMQSGLKLLRVEYVEAKAAYVLSDPDGHGPSLYRAFLGARRLREFLAIRRALIRGAAAARDRASHCITASELDERSRAHLAEATERRRAKLATR